jgi:hypothetical protein
MDVESNGVIHYFLNLNGERGEELNKCLEHRFELVWTGDIFCLNCGKKIKRSFGQGFCYECFTTAPQTAPCIVKPELCEAHLGKGRDPEWEERNHNQPHVVYLAQTASVKVGVTRATQVPTRWLDQGAWRTLIIAETPYRKLAGDIENELKQYLSDRTDWRKMLTDDRGTEDLFELRDQLAEFLPDNLREYAIKDSVINEFEYPVDSYPSKVTTIDLDKEQKATGRLTGIRGQYLYFDRERVINLRKYGGYEVEVSCE